MKNRYENFRKENEYFTELAEERLKMREDALGKKIQGYLESIDFYDTAIDLNYYEDSHCGCCSGDQHYYELKVEDLVLTNDEYKKKLENIKFEREEKIRIEKERKEQEEKEKARLKKIQKEQDEKELYEQLKKKYQ